MNEIDEQLDNIGKFEAGEPGSFQSSYTVIKTATIKMIISVDNNIESKTFKPDKIGAAIGAFIVPVLLVLATIVAIKTQPVVAFILAPVAVTALIYNYVNEVLHNERLNYLLTLSKDGIAYDDSFYKWADIKETAFLDLSVGKKTQLFLVLLFNNSGYVTWEVTDFRSFFPEFSTKLANYIEHFKSLAR